MAVVLLAAPAAHAEAVTSFNWGFDGGFTAWTDQLGTGANSTTFVDTSGSRNLYANGTDGFVSPLPASTNATGFSRLEWGGGTFFGTNCPDNMCRGSDPSRASLSVTGLSSPPQPSLDAGAGGSFGAAQTIANIQYENFVTVPSSIGLDKSTLLMNLTLDPLIPNLPTAGVLIKDLEIDFFDTPDAGMVMTDGLRCAIGTAGESFGCKDVFVVDDSDLNFNFAFEGVNYLFELALAGADGASLLTTLSDEICLYAQATVGCRGFLVEEGTSLTAALNMRFRILDDAAISVPEPAAIGLFGAGLAGLALRRRRRA